MESNQEKLNQITQLGKLIECSHQTTHEIVEEKDIVFYKLGWEISQANQIQNKILELIKQLK